MQGLETKFSVWRLVGAGDDDVGGHVITGSVVRECVQGHFTINPPTLMSLEQGLETKTIATVLLRPKPGTLVIYERDELEITGPSNHRDFGTRWRIISVQYPPMHPSDRKQFYSLKCSRVTRTRSEEWQ